MNKSIKILLNYFLGPVVFIVLSWSLYRQIASQPDLAGRWHQIKVSWQHPVFWLVVVLMIVNWGIESRKWQLLVRHLQPFTFFRAFKSVLAGCSITMLTPNRVGEYGGRILYIDEGNRIKSISLAVVGSISQLLVTMIMGCIGLLVLGYFSQEGGNASGVLPHFWGEVLIYLSVSVTLITFLFYLRLGWLVRMLEKVPAFAKVVLHIKVLDEFNGRQLLSIMWLSFFRYVVFVVQYILLLWVMEVHIEFWMCFWLISVFYLVLAIAPTAGFIELPVRITACWTILKFYTANEIGVSAAALGIWLINLVVPAVIGSLLILAVKVVKEKNETNP